MRLVMAWNNDNVPISSCIAYCKFHKYYLTGKQMKIKGCLNKQCPYLERLEHYYWKKRAERIEKRKMASMTRLKYFKDNVSYFKLLKHYKFMDCDEFIVNRFGDICTYRVYGNCKKEYTIYNSEEIIKMLRNELLKLNELETKLGIDAVRLLELIYGLKYGSINIQLNDGELIISKNRNPEQIKAILEGKSYSNYSLESLGLMYRTICCLNRAKINTVNDLLNCTEEDLMKVRYLGKESYKQLKEQLELNGLKLKEER